jgi:hypothetical protein
MANIITDMSKIRKVIKFYCDGKSKLFISSYLSLSRNTVNKYISLFEVLGLSFELIDKKTDTELELLFSQTAAESIIHKLQTLHNFFPKMGRELKKVSVTIQHMWEQYIAINPDGYRSSQFAHHYKAWSKRVNPVMHMNHKAGDKMYVDYAGKTISIIDNDTGEIKEVQFFVAILGASQYTYAEASMSQQKEDFILPVASNQKMNAYLKEIADLCGFTCELSTHKARHTFGSTVTLNNDVSIYVVKEMLGHKSIRQTESYAITTEQTIGREMKNLGSKLDKIKPTIPDEASNIYDIETGKRITKTKRTI